MTARIDPETRERIAFVAAFAGQPLSTFMVEAAVEKAEKILNTVPRTKVPGDFFDDLVAELDTPRPLPRLKRAAEEARRHGLIQ